MYRVPLFFFGLMITAFLKAQDSSGPETPVPADVDVVDAPAEEVVKKKYTTTGIGPEEAPQIDGDLTDAIWEQVSWGGDYIEFQPDENTAPSVQTKFKILYDSKNLYLAFKCYDPEPDKIERRLSRRDGFAGDWVEVNIDSYNDKRSAFSFSITAAGVKGDEFISNNGNNWDSSWNPDTAQSIKIQRCPGSGLGPAIHTEVFPGGGALPLAA